MTINYLRLELKNCIKIMGKSAKNILLIFIAIIIAIVSCSVLLMKSSVFETIDVAIVLPEEQNDSKWALDFLLATESVKSICDITYFSDKEEAMDKLEDGKVKAVIALNADFYEDIDTGVNTPVSIFVPRHVSLNTSVFIELLDDAVKMLQVSQAGVYSAIDVSKQNKIADDVAVLYLMAILDRGATFDKKIVSATGEVDMYQYYFSSGILILLLFTGINFAHMYRVENESLEQILRIYGVSILKQSIVKTSIMTVILWIIMLLYYLVGFVVSSILKFDFLEINMVAVFGMLLVALTIASFIHLVLSIAGRSEYSYGILIAIDIFMILCSGLVVPLAYYPDFLQKIGSLMPLTMWNELVLRLLFDEAGAGILAVAAVFAFIQFMIGTVILCRKK